MENNDNWKEKVYTLTKNQTDTKDEFEDLKWKNSRIRTK